MDRMTMTGKLLEFAKKYRYVILILALGLVLMAIPSKTIQKNASVEATVPKEKEPSINEKLSSVLSQIEGAGRVDVLLTIASGEETIYQTDDTITVGTDTDNTRRGTVTVTDGQRNQEGLIRQINPPSYLGAVVVCQGADSPAVRLAIVEAVSRATGLGADRISVLKMK